MSVDFFVKLSNGLDGESKAEGHTNEIKIHSWSWGASQVTSVMGTGGSGAGKASLSEVSIMKDYDKVSPKLFSTLTKGTHLDSAVLTAQKATGGATGTPFLTVTLSEVYITSVQVSASSEIPMESVSFSYNKIEIDYKTQDAKGTLTTAGSATYTVDANTSA